MARVIVTVLFLAVVAAQPSPRPVFFPTDDGGVVHADEYGTGERGLILAHGGRFTKESWAAQAPAFVEAGFRVLAIDFRGRGQSRGGPQETSADDVHLDVLAAIRYLRESGARTVSVIGASVGGGAAAEAAVRAPAGTIDRLVLLAHSPIDAPEQITAAGTLVILAKEDVSGSGPRLPRLREQYERVPGAKELILLEGDAHAQFLFETVQGERLMRELIRFLTAS
ncbi:MAG: alpha/beta fold hydrolase [Acidobacteria bacterium]|nr:alpha/beta fold hydrolase [Acidobacteriota bacterium]